MQLHKLVIRGHDPIVPNWDRVPGITAIAKHQSHYRCPRCGSANVLVGKWHVQCFDCGHQQQEEELN